MATLGVVFPSLIIITLIAAFLQNFASYPVVAHALAGINAAVVALIAASVFKLGKSTLKGKVAPWIFLGVLVLAQGGGLISDSLALTGIVASIVSTITSRQCWWYSPACWAGSSSIPAKRVREVRRQ